MASASYNFDERRNIFDGFVDLLSGLNGNFVQFFQSIECHYGGYLSRFIQYLIDWFIV